MLKAITLILLYFLVVKSDDLPVNNTLQKVTHGWKKIHDHYDSLSIHGICKFHQTLESMAYEKEFKFFRHNGCRMFMERMTDSTSKYDEVVCKNTKYFFKIDRNEAGLYRVKDFILFNDEKEQIDNDIFFVPKRALLQTIQRLGGDSIEELMLYPEIHLERLEPAEYLGRRVVKLRFASKDKFIKTKTGRLILDGEVIMNPEENWLPYRHVINYAKQPGRLTAGKVIVEILKFSRTGDGYEYPEELTCNCLWKFSPDCEIAALRGVEKYTAI